MPISTINTNSIADDAVTVPKVADPVLTHRNLIINGAMNVAQRGTSSTTSGLETVDRFLNTFGTAAVTQTQDSTVPSGKGFSHSYKQECTTASSATSAFFAIAYNVEAQDLRNSGWDYTNSNSSVTLSFYARSSVAGTYMASLRTDDGTAYNIASQYTLEANTWKRVILTFPGNSNLTINNDTGIGLKVFPMLELGSDYTAGSSFDAWAAHSGSTQSPDANILFHDTTNATFFITGVQLEVGDTATPFEHRSYGDELAKCQRYYQKCGRWHVQGYGYSTGSDGTGSAMMWATTMRAAPAITKSNTTDGGSQADMVFNNISIYGCSPEAVSINGSYGQWYIADVVADAEL